MSLVHLSNTCSHLQNCSKARLSLTSIPSTKMLLALSLTLQKAGFVSAVVRSGPNPPPLLTHTGFPHATGSSGSTTSTSPTSGPHEPPAAQKRLPPDLLDETHPDTAHVTQSNVASRRLWLGLKYWKEQPVLREMKMVSRPKQRIVVGFRELEGIVRGREEKWVRGLSRVGECLFVSTDRGIMESRECVERKIGGLLLCKCV